MPIAPNMTDLVNWYIYDRNVTAANTLTPTRYQFFNVPIGQAGKLKEDTNLEQVQQLPAPQWMNVTHLGFYFDPGMIEVDINPLLRDSWYEFRVGDKVYAEGPLFSAPAGMGVVGYSTRNNVAALSNGLPLVSNMLDLRLPAGLVLGDGTATDGIRGVTILQGQSFRVDLNLTAFTTAVAAAPTNGIGVNLMCILYGILSRGVQ